MTTVKRLLILLLVGTPGFAAAQEADLFVTKTGPAVSAADNDVTYAVSVTPDGSQVFICWNASRGSKNWDCCALTAISIPESERE